MQVDYLGVSSCKLPYDVICNNIIYYTTIIESVDLVGMARICHIYVRGGSRGGCWDCNPPKRFRAAPPTYIQGLL